MKATLLVLVTLVSTACFLAHSPVPKAETEPELWKLEIDGIGG